METAWSWWRSRNLSYDAMTAHTAVVFTRYMMLSLESRESNDNRSLGELFLYFSDEMSDITWIQAFQMLLQMFRTMLSDNTELSDEKSMNWRMHLWMHFLHC